jgi:hypothetical protein
MAGGISASAAESLVTGRDFGDTLMANLPGIIGNTIGNLAAGKIASFGAPKASGDPKLAYDDSAFDDDGAVADNGTTTVNGGSGEGFARVDDIVVTARRQNQPFFMTIGANGQLPDISKIEPGGPLAAGDDYRIGSPFNNRPGKTFLVGGAGDDSEHNYLPLMKRAFESAGIGGIEIVGSSVSDGIFEDASSIIFKNQLMDPSDYAKYSGKINLHVPQGGQLNLIGYSWGGVQVSQTALALAYSGVKVDNVVLLGAPINSDLLAGLASHPNIGRVTVINLGEYGDPIYAGMPDYKIIGSVPKLISQMNQGTGHFVYSQKGPIADARRNYLGNILYHNGVR